MIKKLAFSALFAVLMLCMPSAASAECSEIPTPMSSHISATSYRGTNIWRANAGTANGPCIGTFTEIWFNSGNFQCTLGTMTQGRCVMEANGNTGVQATQYGCGTYQVRRMHRWKLFSGSITQDAGPSVEEENVNCPAPPPQAWELGCDDQNPVYSMWWDYETEQYQCSSPILITTTGAAYRLTSIADGVLFDIDGNGTLNRVAWTHAGDELAWLAIDLNGNGLIDNGKELLGSKTNEGWNGFEALSNIQLAATGKRRSTLDGDDAIYHRLLLWTDRNHDGVSQPNELGRYSKQFSGIQLHYTYNEKGKNLDAYGNSYALIGEAIKRTASGLNPLDIYNRDLKDRTVTIYDVWLTHTK